MRIHPNEVISLSLCSEPLCSHFDESVVLETFAVHAFVTWLNPESMQKVLDVFWQGHDIFLKSCWIHHGLPFVKQYVFHQKLP
jgi:hypothetical protein